MPGHGEEGYRLVMNRDEQRTRKPALPPEWHERDGTLAMWPTDPDSGGTWIASRTDGLTLALVNSYPEPQPELRNDLVSRGVIIPEMIYRDGIEDIIDAFDKVEIELFAPFRLVMIDFFANEETAQSVPMIAVLDWNLREIAVEIHQDGPLCLVSSGLGDSAVAPRLELFERTVLEGRLTTRKQDVFHNHRWHDRPEVSVMMEREEARTVSVTTVEMSPYFSDDSEIMTYRSIEL